jgi:FkbM family methyltransferase
MSERKIKEWAWPYIKNFRTYIDIGASTGTTSSPFIDSFKKIYCFEPNPNSFKELSKFSELICHNYALGNTNEKKLLVMNVTTQNPEHGSLSDVRTEGWDKTETYEVEIKRLDDFKFDFVDFIKIDTEQYELEVVQGALKIIKKHKPTIFFENKRGEADQVILLLLDLGFTVKKWKSDTIAFYTE